MTPAIIIIPDIGDHDPHCDALYARAFGPGRHAKAASRLRDGNMCRRDLSMLAFMGETLVGACRLWPIVAGNGVHALFLGPIAVDVAVRSEGVGHRLVAACLAAIDSTQTMPVILVGDLSFFGSMGFDIVPERQIVMPGPVDPKRLLWRLAGDQECGLPAGRLEKHIMVLD